MSVDNMQFEINDWIYKYELKKVKYCSEKKLLYCNFVSSHVKKQLKFNKFILIDPEKYLNTKIVG